MQLPPGRKAIGSRWVFKVKRKADGSIDRYKARLVAKGFSQRPGFDFEETFAPTAKWAALRAIFALGALEDLEMETIDISTAFLNGDLEHDVYMKEPEGFEELGPGWALKLIKAIYGLKQAGRQWHKKLDSALSTLGFSKVQCDNAIWIYKKDNTRIILPVWVDDMTIVAKSKADTEWVKTELKKHFKLRDLGPVSFLLGVSVERDRKHRRLTLSQRQYILDLLAHYFPNQELRGVDTPLDPGQKLTADMCSKTPEDKQVMADKPYAQLVGSLMYLAIATRPDIAKAVGVLSRFTANPGLQHWKAAIHLCRYVSRTVNYKLTYAPDPLNTDFFTCYSDADHGGNPDNGRSTSGMVVKMGTGAISWSSRLQSIVALSTTEAEYVSAVSAAQEILWLRSLFKEMGYDIKQPTTLCMDNQSALQVMKNPEHHGRMKHLNLRFYWLRDTVAAGHIHPVYLSTDLMPADILTKLLGAAKVKDMCRLLGLGQ